MKDQITPDKTCIICGNDTSYNPRFIDDQGKYLHESCYYQEQKAQSAAAPQASLTIQAPAQKKSYQASIPKSAHKSTARKKTSGSILPSLFSFEGRIPRKTAWGIMFILWVISLPKTIYDWNKAAPMRDFISGSGITLAELEEASKWGAFDSIWLIITLPLLWIGLATAAKRLHDRDKSFWWCLVGIIPVLGGIWVFIQLYCLRGTDGPNRFGSDPLR
jgi:uncharacterized membrane protein YhaH (DUF805 family)